MDESTRFMLQGPPPSPTRRSAGYLLLFLLLPVTLDSTLARSYRSRLLLILLPPLLPLVPLLTLLLDFGYDGALRSISSSSSSSLTDKLSPETESSLARSSKSSRFLGLVTRRFSAWASISFIIDLVLLVVLRESSFEPSFSSDSCSSFSFLRSCSLCLRRLGGIFWSLRLAEKPLSLFPPLVLLLILSLLKRFFESDIVVEMLLSLLCWVALL